MAEEFNLPGSSFEEIQKIIKGYSHAPENASLETLSKLIGLHSTVISRSNKFLTDIGLINGGMKKTATELGKRLGRALDHKQLDDGRRYWKEAIQTNEKVSGLVTTIRIRGGMSEKEFCDHVLYVSGQKNNAGNRTGARCIVDILATANLIQEVDGKLNISLSIEENEEKKQPATPAQPLINTQPSAAAAEILGASAASASPIATTTAPQIAINIQLHLPETENADVYEKLFKALKEHLLPKA